MGLAQRVLAGVFATAMAAAPGAFAQSKPGDQSKEPVRVAQAFKPASAAIDPALKITPRQLPFVVSDVRGKGEAHSAVLARLASSKIFTVLEIHGDDPALRRRAEDALRAVAIAKSPKRERVGLVIGDGNPKEWNIYAEGRLRNHLDNADDSDKTEILAGHAIADAYDEYTAPALKAAQEAAQKPTSASAPANER